MKTFSAKPNEVRRNWYIIDAENKILGKLASFAATRLKGKHKPEYTTHVDAGDYIVVINADKIKVSGNKAQDKLYHHHSGYPGGLKTSNFEKMQAQHPTRIIELAIKGMLPKNPLGREMFKKLKVYSGTNHPHQAQQPHLVTID